MKNTTTNTFEWNRWWWPVTDQTPHPSRASDWYRVNPNGSSDVDLTAATDEQIEAWKGAQTLREIKLFLRIQRDRAEVESLKTQLEANHEWEARVDRELEIEQELHFETMQRAEKAEAEVERLTRIIQDLEDAHAAQLRAARQKEKR